MEAEIVQQMVTSGASSLAGLMATAAWQQVSSRVSRMFGRGEEDEATGAELEEIRAEVLEAGDDREALADQTAVLRARLRRLFRENPAAVAELRDLLAEFAPQEATRIGSVHNVIRDSTVNSDIVIQAGTTNQRF
ncbi:hypothetical protein [Streptomyces sp. CBMA123]|uniref:hypothetical protein n=1 Tax=Streptomyces sp. CBMA123 TaxID=1896313 RepID=UPI001661A167|nr:hypothetical protein [Streptomyces sp. CBMA123]MBD0695581.1 hypothetical protein [Streptomyces sp. CBMA123]